MFNHLQGLLKVEMVIKVIMNSFRTQMWQSHNLISMIGISKAQCFLLHYEYCLIHSCMMFHLYL